jgi:hypothetical protein
MVLRIKIVISDNQKSSTVFNRFKSEGNEKADEATTANKTIKMTIDTCLSQLAALLVMMLNVAICMTSK